MRLNDFVFAVHAVILSSITYSQFWPKIWGLAVSRHQKSSKPVKGIFWGLVLAVGIVICVVLGKSPDGGYDPSSWAWIDVVSNRNPHFSIAYTHKETDLLPLIRKTSRHDSKIRPSSLAQLQTPIDGRLENRNDPLRLLRRNSVPRPVGHRLEFQPGLERYHGEPGQVHPVQRLDCFRFAVHGATLCPLWG